MDPSNRRSQQNDELDFDEDHKIFNTPSFLRELTSEYPSNETFSGNGYTTPRIRADLRGPSMDPQFVDRPRLCNKTMLRGLVERTEHYNKNVDRKVLSGARMAFEDEHWKGENFAVRPESSALPYSNQHIPTRGRGDTFGRLRSVDLGDVSPGASSSAGFFNSSSHLFNNNNLPPDYSRLQSPQKSYQSSIKPCPPANSADTESHARHQFNPATAYNGKVTPGYRFNYNPSANANSHIQPTPITPAPARPGQRYPKRPDNIPQIPTVPKHLNHNYYQINLYGSTQEERIAQRIEKTVRQTEAPPRRF